MEKVDVKQILNQTISKLSDPKLYGTVFHESNYGSPMPSVEVLELLMKYIREIIFPGYFGHNILKEETITYYTGVLVDKLYMKLSEQICRGFFFDCDNQAENSLSDYKQKAEEVAAKFIERLPEIRRVLSTDIVAAYNGDPAAKSYGEIIFCYPVIKALLNYRVAHELLLLDVPLIPRIITEMAHSETGIDIHPAAQIGEYFTIDHGTGVVIGATCIIGCHVQLYQGVTLGAKSFPLDADGNPIKGIPRHPIVEDNVVIYSNASILGRITIGHDSMIGGNVWVTKDVPPHSKILQSAR